jgi:hypothetical protein
MIATPIDRLIAERQEHWLRETYSITSNELMDAPLSFRSEVQAAWVRYWRKECTEGRGIQLPEPQKTMRGSRRA